MLRPKNVVYVSLCLFYIPRATPLTNEVDSLRQDVYY